jgi:cell division protein FtsB
MPLPLLQLPFGPEAAIILLVFVILFVVPVGILLVVLVGYSRRKSTEKSESQRIKELEQRVDELERE